MDLDGACTTKEEGLADPKSALIEILFSGSVVTRCRAVPQKEACAGMYI